MVIKIQQKEGERMWGYGDGIIKLNPDDELPEQVTFGVNYDDIMAIITKRKRPKRIRRNNIIRKLNTKKR